MNVKKMPEYKELSKALVALYLAVPESVADDLREKLDIFVCALKIKSGEEEEKARQDQRDWDEDRHWR